MFENDERNDTGSYQIIILTVLVRKYRAIGFGLQNKELEAVSILVGRQVLFVVFCSEAGRQW